MRVSEAPPGWRVVKSNSNGGVVFKRTDDVNSHHRVPTANGRTAGHDWPRYHRECVRRIEPDRLRSLSRDTGLSVEALSQVGCGWNGVRYTFPERDAECNVIGILARRTDGRKRCLKGSKRGVIVPEGFDDLMEPVLIVEGPTDTASCWMMELPAMGRPSNRGGSEYLAKLVGDREVIVVGENDRRMNDGKEQFPGRDGARDTARSIADQLGRPIGWALPPSDHKDVRAFMRTSSSDSGDPVALTRLGREFLDHLRTHVTLEEPASVIDDGDPSLPIVVLPGKQTPITSAASELAALLAERGDYFVRSDQVVKVHWTGEGMPSLQGVSPAMLASDGETVARLRTNTSKGLASDICSERLARLILASPAFIDGLPVVHVVSPCPLLVSRGGDVETVIGFDPRSGLLCGGKPVVDVEPDAAREHLRTLVDDFSFATPADRSRAIASIITPALVLGGFLGGRAPLDLSEADKSQAGKSYRNRVTAAVYRQGVATVAQRKRGVGGIEEAIDTALLRGSNFIALDNIRGKVDLPSLESLLTENTHMARVPHRGHVEIDPRRVIFMMTSNRAEITPDLANRSSCVRIRKQPHDFEFRRFGEGDLLGHVEANQPMFLGAVFAIIRAWHHQGMPAEKYPRHSFQTWAGVLDWIVQELLEEAPLLDGHGEMQTRVSHLALSWLRTIALEVAERGLLERSLRAADLLEVVRDVVDPSTLGVKSSDELDDPTARSNALRAIGRRMSRCFVDRESLTIDGIRIDRSHGMDDESRPTKIYLFSRLG
jgi:hypothetical protein